MGAFLVKKTRPVGPAGWRVYLRKAVEFHRSMRAAEARGDWNAVGLNAVHTVISAADAIVAMHTHERSSSEDHGEAVDLLRELPYPGASPKADQAAEVLNAKDLVEYQARDFEPKEAVATARRTDRFLEWVQETLRRR